MKIGCISDTHIDFWVREENPQNPKFKKQINKFVSALQIPEDIDALVIAGDIGHIFLQDTAVLLKIKDKVKHVLVTYGNHDLYLISKKIQKKYDFDSYKRLEEFKQWCRGNDIHFLQGNTVTLDGVTFGGTGMSWDNSYARKYYKEASSDISLQARWEKVMRDSTLMFQDGKRCTSFPLAYGAFYTEPSFKPFEHFKKEKALLNQIEDCDVMVTHYAPKVSDCIPSKYHNIDSVFYHFDGKDAIRRIKPKVWIYGHTHRPVDEVFEGCRLICNPLGYPDEEKELLNTKETIIKTFVI